MSTDFPDSSALLDIESDYHEEWLEIAGTTSSFRVPKGARCIALGCNDSVGAVRITPQKSQGSTPKSYIVSARSPYVGMLSGNMMVTPVVENGDIGSPDFQILKASLDLRYFEALPPFEPHRSVLVVERNIFSAALNEPWINVRGRRRTVITVFAAGGGADSFTIDRALVGDVGTNIISNTRAAVAGQLWYELNFNGAPNAQPSVGGSDVVDYIRIRSTTVGAPVYTMILQAWD